jgi:hypothetical protein
MQNKMPLVDMQCFKLSKYPNNCVHYVLYDYEDCYNLNYDYTIKLHSNDPHFEKASNVENNICGNPWNNITSNEAEYIKSNKPKVETYLLRFSGFVSSKLQKNVTMEHTIKELTSYIGADCWQVYLKDPKSNYPVNILFDYRRSNSIENDDERELQQKNDQIIRNHIMDNAEQYLNESLDRNLTLCVILGYKNFIDVYFYPDIQNGIFDIIINRYN